MNLNFDNEKLKKLIEERGFTTKHVAKNVVVSQRTLQEYLCGRRPPRGPVVKLLALFFNVPESYFYDQAA